jgi:hypothetical protein
MAPRGGLLGAARRCRRTDLLSVGCSNWDVEQAEVTGVVKILKINGSRGDIRTPDQRINRLIPELQGYYKSTPCNARTS